MIIEKSGSVCNDIWVNSGISNIGLIRYNAYIDGEWVNSSESINVYNPASEENLGSVSDVGAQGARQAVESAHAAFPEWRSLSARERAAKLAAWAQAVLRNQEDLARIMSLEQGKPLAEARGEVAYAASYLQWFAEEARRAYGDVIPGHDRNKRLVVTREPIGVVVAITPWNFPLAMIARKVGPALAAGCTIIVKPSEYTPFSALALAVLAEEVGIPRGVLQIVTGAPAPIGEVLLSHDHVRKLSFTGSTAVGKQLAARAMQTVKRVSLELGGNAPLLIFNDANIDQAVEGALVSKFRNAGQTCVCVNRILVQTGVLEIFVERLRARINDFVIGAGLDDHVTVGPLINEAAVAKVERHVADAVSRGATVLAGGMRINGPGHFFAPTLIRDVPADALICHEETFGPVAAIVSFDKEEEAVRLANDTLSGLAAYVFTRDLSRSVRVCEALEYGMVGLNTGMISTEVAPFGGIKESGVGREGSLYGMDDYLNMKVICSEI